MKTNFIIFLIISICLISTSCNNYRKKTPYIRSCPLVIEKIKHSIENNGTGKLTSDKSISDLLITGKECLVGLKKDSIVNILGLPNSISNEPFRKTEYTFSYITSNGCYNSRKVCRQIIFRVQKESDEIYDFLILVSN